MDVETERRALNGAITQAINDMRGELAQVRTYAAETRATLTELKADFRVDQMERRTQQERAPALVKKIEDLWDFRNRLLGALAVATIAIPLLSVALERLIPR